MSITNKNNNISVVINTFNEEENLQECILSIIWVDEIIIVDSGSKDKTIHIAKKYTQNIIFLPKCDYVEQIRNFGIEKSKSEWVLILDADETVPSESERVIRNLIKNKSFDGYLFPRRNYISKTKYLKHGYFFPDYQLRLFRNRSDIRFSGVIHDQPKIKKNRLGIVSEVEIIHNSSHSKYNSFYSFRRFFPYILIEGKNLASKKDRGYKFIFSCLYELVKHFYRSLIKLEGYKDGYSGYRAAILFGLYKGSIELYAFWHKIKSIRKYEV